MNKTDGKIAGRVLVMLSSWIVDILLAVTDGDDFDVNGSRSPAGNCQGCTVASFC